MPNHLHGIILIEDKNQMMFKNENRRNAPGRVLVNNANRTAQQNTILQNTIRQNTIRQNTPRRVPTGLHPLIKNSLSSIINHFKGNVKRYCNKNGFEYFAWQPRFHDRIVRNEKELENIQNYIHSNPVSWEQDRNNQEDLFM